MRTGGGEKKKVGQGWGGEGRGRRRCSSGKDEWRFKRGSKGPPIVRRLSVVGEGHFDLPGGRVHGVGRAAERHTAPRWEGGGEEGKGDGTAGTERGFLLSSGRPPQVSNQHPTPPSVRTYARACSCVCASSRCVFELKAKRRVRCSFAPPALMWLIHSNKNTPVKMCTSGKWLRD